MLAIAFISLVCLIASSSQNAVCNSNCPTLDNIQPNTVYTFDNNGCPTTTSKYCSNQQGAYCLQSGATCDNCNWCAFEASLTVAEICQTCTANNGTLLFNNQRWCCKGMETTAQGKALCDALPCACC